MTVDARLAHAAFDPAAALDVFTRQSLGAGAVASFIGLVREADAQGGGVTRLFLDHHPRLTLRSLEEIAGTTAERFGLISALVIHRCGEVPAGEAIVLAAAAASHRRAAFEAVDHMMDRLKTDAVFWKREEGVDGGRWIEPTDADRADRARWKN